jgi:hypothetical protein
MSQDEAADEIDSDAPTRLGVWFLIVLSLIGIGCLLAGSFGQVDGRRMIAAIACVFLGLMNVAIGVLNLEWLEQALNRLGIAAEILSGSWRWLWQDPSQTASDSPFLGRRGARVLWTLMGLVLLTAGCVIALWFTAV